ncbi:hypothetical protein WJX74_009876 [Apatococcus lobatus]|uniref:Protein kinase domain-containing protein n=2 Tax=Apatococcus TaxID=904362 RepID=A0AAW1RKM9_9CHLO
MADIAAANGNLAAQMKVALAVEQGCDSPNLAGSSSLGRQTSGSDLAAPVSARQGSLEDALGNLSASTIDALANAASHGSSMSGSRQAPDKDEEYGLIDGWHDMCGIAQRLMGWSSTGEAGSDSTDEEENSYQILQQMLADLQDQSWLIDQDQLSVCVQRDGSDLCLGQGSFGSVYKGVMNKSVSVAIKSVRNPSMQAKMEFVNEMAMLMNLRHQNIVQCLGAVIDRKNLLLIMELMPRGDLYRNLQRDREGVLRWQRRGQAVAMDIVRGVLHMHDLGIVHQDIKSGNVMLTRDFAAKIGDVGLAAVFSHSDKTRPSGTNRQSSSNPGTLEWCAPEILQGKPSSSKADVYALGIVLWELLTGEVPKRGRIRPLRCPKDCPAEIASSVERCMEADPDRRPTTLELFECLSSHSLPAGRALSEKQL